MYLLPCIFFYEISRRNVHLIAASQATDIKYGTAMITLNTSDLSLVSTLAEPALSPSIRIRSPCLSLASNLAMCESAVYFESWNVTNLKTEMVRIKNSSSDYIYCPRLFHTSYIYHLEKVSGESKSIPMQ